MDVKKKKSEKVCIFVPCFPELRFKSEESDVDVRNLMPIKAFSNLKSKTFYFKGDKKHEENRV